MQLKCWSLEISKPAQWTYSKAQASFDFQRASRCWLARPAALEFQSAQWKKITLAKFDECRLAVSRVNLAISRVKRKKPKSHNWASTAQLAHWPWLRAKSVDEATATREQVYQALTRAVAGWESELSAGSSNSLRQRDESQRDAWVEPLKHTNQAQKGKRHHITRRKVP